LIRGNLIGTRLGGNAGLGNSDGGVVIADNAASNFVGGVAANARNAISANNLAGVFLGAGATRNLVAANLIGIGADGSTRLGNVGPGVNIDGGTDNTVGGVVAAARNIIGGNEGDGVRLHGDATRRNTILGNFVGTNEAGSVGRGNSGNGISIDAALNNTVGGATGDPGKGAGNLVSANGGDGVQLSQGATGNLVGGNLIGSDLAGTSELGNTNSGVSLNNAIANTIGTSAGSSPNRIAFNSIGVRFNGGSGNTVSGNTIDHNDSDGVQLTGGAKDQRFASNTVRDNVGNGFSILGAQESPSPNNSPSNNWIGQGNVIRNNSLHGVQLSGPESKGNRVLGSTIVENRLYGVFISNAKQNFIGPETVPADRNVIAGNQSHGVVIQGLDATGNWVGNNLVGTESGPGNQGDGVVILDGGNNTVQHNKIAMNLGSGMVITNTNPGASTSPEPNFIQDNEIGLFGIGGNVLHGLSILNSGNNRILRNTIAHSGLHGVSLFGSGAHSNILEGNRITANKLDGLNLVDAPNNRIQGHNEIWSNHNEGIEISGQGSTGNTVERNSIISNALVGVRVVSAAFNIIGVGNVISGNGGAGVEITGASGGTVVRGNMIGVAADGMRELGNAIGVLLNETGNVTVGGATDGSANIISGNKRTGVQIAGTGSKDNFILNNLIGLAPDGTTFLGNGRTNVEAVSGDGVGVWVVEASRNTIRGNLISGNDFAGVHIQGRNATNNLVWENRIGVDANDQTPYQRAFPGVAPADRIVQDFKLLQEHEDSYRAQGILPQTHGVLINATIRNLVKSNLIAGNDIGVRAIGDTSTTDDANPRGNRNHNNRIQGNSIRDNEFGILIDGAPDITVGHEATRKVDWKAAVNEYANTIHHNLSIGVTIRGGLAVRNLVKGNIIIANQGQTWLPLERPDDPQRSKAHIGTGIYVERANTNKIEQNKLMGNKLAGVYFFDNSWNNKVRRNRITPSDGVRADYGVLLFNSARNVFDVVRKGRGRNIIKSSFIANFREFTGPRTNTLVELPDLPFELETAQASTPAGPVALLKRGGGRNRRG
jgi:parallel beta-helix repeat protein